MKRSLSPSVKRGHRRSRSDSSMLQVAGSRRSSAGSQDGLSALEASDMLGFAEEEFLDFDDATYIDLGGPGQPGMLSFEEFAASRDKDQPEGHRRRSSSGNSLNPFFQPPPPPPMGSPSMATPKGHRRTRSEPPDKAVAPRLQHLDSLDELDTMLQRASDLSNQSFNMMASPRSDHPRGSTTSLNLQFSMGGEDTLAPLGVANVRNLPLEAASRQEARLRINSATSVASDDPHGEGRMPRLSSSDLQYGFVNRGSTNSADWDEALIRNSEQGGVTESRHELPPAPAPREVFGEMPHGGSQASPIYDSRSGSGVLGTSEAAASGKPTRSPRAGYTGAKQRKVEPDSMSPQPGGPGISVARKGMMPNGGVFVGSNGQVFPMPNVGFAPDAALFAQMQNSGRMAGAPKPQRGRYRSTGSANSDTGSQASDGSFGSPSMAFPTGQSTFFKNRGRYKCGKCGQPKANHVCPFDAPPTRSVASQVDLRVTQGGVMRDQAKDRVLVVNRRSQWGVQVAAGGQ